MAEDLNSYFASVFTKEDINNVLEVLRETSSSEELKEIGISGEMFLGKLKVDKSSGPDDLHPRVLKEVALEKVDSLVVSFQKSLDSGLVSTDWRAVNVSPLFKKGGREKTELWTREPNVSTGEVTSVHYQGFHRSVFGKQWYNQTKSAWIYEREIMLDKSAGNL